jgi:hypothetical protein
VKRFALALLLTLVCVGAPVGGGAGADPPDSAGWWWKAQATGLVQVPAPPTVPAGGLYVAGDPTGPFGVSAIRLLVPAGAVVGQLVLRVASAQGAIAMRACPTPIPWGPEQGGQMAGAPTYDCSAFANGTHDAAANTVVFEISPLVRDGLLNVVVLPQAGAVFQASFHPPGPDTVGVSQGSTSASDLGPSPAYEDSYLEGPAFSDPLVVNAPTPFEPGYAPVVAAPTPPTSVAPRRVPIVLAPRQAQPVSKSGGKDRDSIIASAVFTSLLGLFWFLISRPTRAPRALGPLAGGGGEGGSVVMTRGVGRFRRARVGPAPRL